MNRSLAYGALGQEFSGNIGDDANEMGDYLKPIDLGNRFEIENVYAMSHGCCGMYESIVSTDALSLVQCPSLWSVSEY